MHTICCSIYAGYLPHFRYYLKGEKIRAWPESKNDMHRVERGVVYTSVLTAAY
jgi:hypothetical protein